MELRRLCLFPSLKIARVSLTCAQTTSPESSSTDAAPGDCVLGEFKRWVAPRISRTHAHTARYEVSNPLFLSFRVFQNTEDSIPLVETG